MAATTLGERLRQARERRGWTMSTLARQARVSETLVHRLEQDRITIVTGRKLPAVARALGVDLRELLATDDERAA
jgi:transcriptional regulator with XRE-family HTH domain